VIPESDQGKFREGIEDPEAQVAGVLCRKLRSHQSAKSAEWPEFSTRVWVNLRGLAIERRAGRAAMEDIAVRKSVTGNRW